VFRRTERLMNTCGFFHRMTSLVSPLRHPLPRRPRHAASPRGPSSRWRAGCASRR
jgi:hypothetical protein